jgi:hypothetical protein
MKACLKSYFCLQDFAVILKATLLRHDTLLDATADFDIFAKKNQKVTLTVKLLKNPVPTGFNITGFISAKGKVSGGPEQ